MTVTTPAASAWDAERGRLFGIAYRMLGDAGEAEDVVSEVALHALRAEDTAGVPVRSWPAWLTTTCVRRSVDRLRALAARREEYPGPWLPEPVATDRLPEEVAAGRDLLSIGLLHLAEQLSPRERAAVVLHRAFAMPAPEIAEILGTTPAAVRQLVSRGQRRLELVHEPSGGSQAGGRGDAVALRALVRAIEEGDVSAVVALLADDAVLWSDGGGKVRAAINPVLGADRIARFFVGVLAKAARSGVPVEIGLIEVNGTLAADLRQPTRRDVLSIACDADGRITGLHQVSNPDKLSRV